MSSKIIVIDSVTPYGDNLSIVKTKDGETVIANRKEDGSFRWKENEIAAFVSEGSIIPDEILKERGYWDEEKDRGLLDGSKRNRVKKRKWGPDKIVGDGLLFKVENFEDKINYDSRDTEGRISIKDGDSVKYLYVCVGDDVSEFLGIVEHQS